MWKKLLITTALSGAVIGAALAQQGTPGSSPPAAAAQQQAQPKAGKSAATGAAQFISAQLPDQWLASRFKGTDVVGSDGKNIGSVSDILFDRSGTIKAYVVSVGGFLGIGTKDVALAPQSFEVVAGDKSKAEGDKLRLAMTAEQLKQAANFQPYNPPRPTAGAGNLRPAPGGPARTPLSQ